MIVDLPFKLSSHLIGSLMFFVLLQPAFAQTVPSSVRDLKSARIPEIDSESKIRLKRLMEHIEERQWSQAIDVTRQLIGSQRNQLVVKQMNSASFQKGIGLEDYLHELIRDASDQNPELLHVYRQRIDPLVGATLGEAMKSRNRSDVYRILNDYGLSRHGAKAMNAMAELALANESFFEARVYWSLLLNSLPDQTTAPSNSALFSDFDLSRADIVARMIYASILERDLPRASQELIQFQKDFPEASGRFGGRQAGFADVLQQLLKDARLSPQGRPIDGVTYGGNFTRNFIAACEIDPEFAPIWRIKLPTRTDPNRNHPAAQVQPPVPACDPRMVPVHPIICHNAVLFCDEVAVYAYDLNSGSPIGFADEDGIIYKMENESPAETRQRPPCLSLSADGSKVYAVMGYGNHSNRRSQNATTSLVGIDLASEGRLLFSPIRPETADAWFDGCPVIRGDRIFVTIRKTGSVADTSVACYEYGRRIWQTKVCSQIAGRDLPTQTANSSSLLTLAENTLYLNTHQGIVAAIDADLGDLRWVVQYPSHRAKRTNLLDFPWSSYRVPAPCLWDEGMLFVAPRDYQGVFALDAHSGDLIWKTNWTTRAFDANQLIAATSSHLIASGKRIWWIDRQSGKLSTAGIANPLPTDLQAKMYGCGRGFLAGRSVYIPVRGASDQIYVFDWSRLDFARQPIQLTPTNTRAGNLVWAKQYLLIANEHEIVAFRTDVKKSNIPHVSHDTAPAKLE